MDLTAMTPAQIDAEMAPIWQRYLAAGQKRYAAVRTVNRLGNSVRSADRRRVEQARLAIRQADEVMTAELPDINAYQAEWDKRGGWPQVWLCTSSDSGHYHRGRHCGSLRWNSEIGLIPMFSGLTEAEIIEAIGSDACTRCYPNAPVDQPSTRGPLFESRAAEAEAKAARAAELAAKRAAADAKAITAPDGSPLRDDLDMVIKTERTAEQYYVAAAAEAATWGDDWARESYPQRWQINAHNEQVYANRLLAALAHKHGETVEQARERLAPKVARKIKNERAQNAKVAAQFSQ